jgi:hypothetical protein
MNEMLTLVAFIAIFIAVIYMMIWVFNSAKGPISFIFKAFGLYFEVKKGD